MVNIQPWSGDPGLAAAYAALGRALVNDGDLLSAGDQLHRALLAARRAGNVRWQAEGNYLVGKVDWKEGDFEGARYNWTRAARLAEEAGDALLEGRIQLQEGLVLYTEGRLKESVPVYQAAIRQIAATGNVRLLMKAYSSLSRVLARLGSWRAMEKLLDERLRLAREHQLAKAEAVALTDLAELKLLQGYVAAAEAAVQQPVQLHGKTVYARTQRILGRVLLADHEPALAVEAFEKGGYKPLDRANPTTCYDIHATMMHLLGIDHEKLTVRHNGLDRRLTDVHGHVIRDLIA